MTEPYRVCVIDPAWKFGDSLPGKTRGASKQYPCMTVPELCAYELPPMADDSLLFMWRVSSMQQEALTVMQAWCYRLHSEMVWNKTTKHGKQHFGMGRIVRGSHETCLIGVRGKPKIKSRSVRSSFSAPVGRHSEKPSLFFSLVEMLSDGPYVEVFARRYRPGWDAIGNQLPANDISIQCA